MMGAKRASLVVALLAVTAVAIAVGDAALEQSEAAFPLTLRWGNCVGDLEFIGCEAFVGQWIVEPPKIIPSNSTGVLVVAPPGTGAPTVGNCTYSYTNKHGTWVAYITWEYSFIGSQNFGVGTGDWIDDEVSMLADPRLLANTTMVCAVTAYGESPGEACAATLCPPGVGCGSFDDF